MAMKTAFTNVKSKINLLHAFNRMRYLFSTGAVLFFGIAFVNAAPPPPPMPPIPIKPITGKSIGDGSLAINARLFRPEGISFDSHGNLYIADPIARRVRRVGENGLISTIAGSGNDGYSGDGAAATSAELSQPTAVATDANGNIYIADSRNNCIRKVDLRGVITTVAGKGTEGYSGDGGAAIAARLSQPVSIAFDANGNLYIAEHSGQRVRKVDAHGIITTIAGNGTSGYSGDGGAAVNAELAGPMSVAIDANGDLFIIDDGNNRIRKVDEHGMITTVAGDGVYGYAGDGGLANKAELASPAGMAFDAKGNLYVADSYNNRVRKIDTNGIITTIVGKGTGGDGHGVGLYSGDGGMAVDAELNEPSGLAIDAIGNLYISDSDNGRVRKVDAQGRIMTVVGGASPSGTNKSDK